MFCASIETRSVILEWVRNATDWPTHTHAHTQTHTHTHTQTQTHTRARKQTLTYHSTETNPPRDSNSGTPSGREDEK